ncbi:MAG: hypothetical protein ACLQVD_00735 [Capsulimonadaceae bacterium]
MDGTTKAHGAGQTGGYSLTLNRPSSNELPSVSMTSPAADATYATLASIVMTATATAANSALTCPKDQKA